MNLEDHAFNAAPPGQHERVSCVTLSMAEAAIKAAVEKERNMWADVVSRNVSGDTLKKILDAFNQARGAAHE